MRVVTCLLIFASLLLEPGTVSAQGELSQIQQSASTPSAPARNSANSSSSRSKKRSNRDYSDDCGDELFNELFGELFITALVVTCAAPFYLPPKMAQDDYRSAGYFADYPYQPGVHGNMMIDPHVPVEPSAYSFQLRTEYADDFDSISRIGTRVLFDTRTRLGIDSEFNYWRESLDAGAGQYDDLWTGDANLVFRFVQTPSVQMRTGIGLNWMADDQGNNQGFNFTYQGDFFPWKPWVVSAELDLGSLGDETLLHGRITTGLQWKRAEVFVGYDYYEVDQTELRGFVSGLRWWF